MTDTKYWRPHEDDMILNKWGNGMDWLRSKMPDKSISDIFGRRIYLLKRKGVSKL